MMRSMIFALSFATFLPNCFASSGGKPKQKLTLDTVPPATAPSAGQNIPAPGASAKVESKAKDTVSHEADKIDRQILVAFKSANNRLARESIVKQYAAIDGGQVGSSQLYMFELPVGADVAKALADIKTWPQVKYAERNLRMRTFQGAGGAQ